jgi:hypothetical protein
MEKETNKLVIIGNGFDLAHGLKTKYSDFMLWYFNDIFKIHNSERGYSDKLIEVSSTKHSTVEIPKQKSLAGVKQVIENQGFFFDLKF